MKPVQVAQVSYFVHFTRLFPFIQIHSFLNQNKTYCGSKEMLLRTNNIIFRLAVTNIIGLFSVNTILLKYKCIEIQTNHIDNA